MTKGEGASGKYVSPGNCPWGSMWVLYGISSAPVTVHLCQCLSSCRPITVCPYVSVSVSVLMSLFVLMSQCLSV